MDQTGLEQRKDLISTTTWSNKMGINQKKKTTPELQDYNLC